MTDDRLRSENAELRRRLEEAEDTLVAIRTGAVDAFVVQRPEGERIYTLEGADRPYRILVEKMQQGAVTLADDGGITYCNVRFAELVGVPHERLFGRPLGDFVAPEGRADYEQLLQDPSTDSRRGETILLRADGTTVPVFLTFNEFQPDTGVSVGVLVTDLTTQRHQERLSATLQLLRTTLASIGDAVITTDNEGRIVFQNEVAQHLTGWTPEEAAGHPLDAVFRIVDERTHEPLPNPALAALARGRTVSSTNRTVLIAKDGGERPVDDSAAPIRDGQGRTSGAVLVFRDVSERRRIDAELRAGRERLDFALVAADLGQWDLNLRDRTAVRTLRHDQIFGYEELLPEWTYDMFLEHVLPEERSSVDAGFQRALATGSAWDLECRIRRVDGAQRWIWVKGRIQCDADGNIERMLGMVGDITESKRVEKELKEARSRLESTLSAGDVGTWEFDPVAGVVRADPNLARMFGIPLEQAEAGPLEPFLDAIHPDDRDRVNDEIGAALASGAKFESEYRILRAEGGVRWISARGRVERDETGTAVRLPGVLVDVTARREVEERLRASEERRRLALDAAELGTWNIDPATNTLTTDARFRAIFAGTDEQIDYERAFALVHQDDRGRVRQLVADATRPENPVPYLAEYRVVHPDGSVHWVFAKGRSQFEATADGRRLVSFDGTVADITERRTAEEALRESEARFRQLADTIPQLAWTARPDGHIDWYNDRWYEYTGTTFEEMQGWGWQQVQDPDVLPLVLAQWRNSLESGRPFDMVFPIRGADGVYRPFLTKVLPFRDAEGRIERWFGTNTDIGQQQRMQDELQRTAAELSAADRRKDEFLATLAHELRNPLSPIRSATQLLQRIEGDDQLHELTDVIDRQVRQMVRLIDDLLDVSRISRGKITLQTALCDLRDIVEIAAESAAPLMQQSGHEFLVTNFQGPLHVEGDAARLSQVLINLLSNAARYTPDGGRVRLVARREPGRAVLEVHDNGTGIAADDLARVFEMFHQVDTGRHHGETGLGIGLSLVKNLVELHDGEVTVESPGVGRGSTFTVRLPTWSGRPPSPEADETRDQPAASGRRFRVLVVEDLRANRQMLVRLLQSMGHEVEEAADGDEGLRKVASFEPEVILSDISMPRMNGHEMVRTLRAHGRRIPMIALTGYGQDADRDNARAAGFDDHMVKPAGIAELSRLFAELSVDDS